MPAKSIAQQRLMGMALSCKRDGKNCDDDEVKKLATSMSLKSLLKYAKTKHDNLPYKIKNNENSVIYSINKNIDDKEKLIEFLKLNNVNYNFIDEDKFISDFNFNNFSELENYYDIRKDYYSCCVLNDNLATLANTVGLGSINPPQPSSNGSQPGNGNTGSGDRFDNKSNDDDDEEETMYDKLKKRNRRHGEVDKNKKKSHNENI